MATIAVSTSYMPSSRRVYNPLTVVICSTLDSCKPSRYLEWHVYVTWLWELVQSEALAFLDLSKPFVMNIRVPSYVCICVPM